MGKRTSRSKIGSRRRRQGVLRGYTIVEVMMALAVLSIGASGVIAMQKVTLLGGVRARNLATGTAIASGWVERLKYDALQWRLTETSQNTIKNTFALYVVEDDFPQISSKEGIWVRAPSDKAADVSPMADVRGQDTFVAKDAAYCTQVRLTQMMPNLIRAEVRVFWLRNKGTNQTSKYAGTISGKPLCDDDAGYIQQVSSAHDRYHFVYMTTAINRNDSTT